MANISKRFIITGSGAVWIGHSKGHIHGYTMVRQEICDEFE